MGDITMRARRPRARRVAIGAAIAGLVTTGLLAGTAAAGSGTAPGLAAKSVKLGYVFSGTGQAGSVYQDAGKACQARVGRQNAQGGVNGRKIDLQVIDDATSAANLTAVHDLVENRNVFAVINNSPVAFLSYRYLLEKGVPMIGSGTDGTYYGQKGNENIINMSGNQAAATDITWTEVPQVMKMLGATKTAAVTYGSPPSGIAAATVLQKYGAPAVGLEPVYTNTAVDFGTEDVAPIVLGIKNSGADAAWLPMVAATNFAIVQSLQQNGVKLKANVLATGYGQTLLDSPLASTLGPETVFFQQWQPVELKTAATKQFQADLKKYAGVTGVPNFGTYSGYIICDLAIKGLEASGKNPTRQGMIDAIHKMGAYDQAGLACQPVDVGLANYGKAPEQQCIYFLNVKDGKFVVMNKGKPIIGKLVGSKEGLAAARSGAVATTTTAAPPSP